jgi:hypothetical protein
VIFKVGFVYKEILSKSIFLEVYNPYNNKYDQIKDFSYGVLQSVFPEISNLQNCCIFDKVIENLYKMDKLKSNNHWEFIQYVHFIFRKTGK